MGHRPAGEAARGGGSTSGRWQLERVCSGATEERSDGGAGEPKAEPKARGV